VAELGEVLAGELAAVTIVLGHVRQSARGDVADREHEDGEARRELREQEAVRVAGGGDDHGVDAPSQQ
jgi:hypothetical protein